MPMNIGDAVREYFPPHLYYNKKKCWICGGEPEELFTLTAPTDKDFRNTKVKSLMREVVQHTGKVRMCKGCIRNMNMLETYHKEYGNDEGHS